jgi:pilus assembly protein FimV
MKKKLLTESQMRRMAAIAGIPALGGIVGRLAEKLDIQAEGDYKEEKEEMEETNEEVVVEEEEMEMDAEAEVEMEPEMEEPAGEEVSQDKIESLVDAVLAAIESETGVPAERVSSEEEMPAEEPEMEMDAEAPAEEPEMEMDAEEEMMEVTEPTLAERIAQAVQSVIDEDAAVAEGYDMDEDEEQIEESAEEDEEDADEAQLDEITKAVVARLRSLK